MFGKKFYSTLAALILVEFLATTSIVRAEIRNYQGVDEYIMSEFETLEIAKQRARQKAARNAQEQAGVYIESYTKTRNAQVSEDEIIIIAAGILNIIDAQYKLTPLEDGKSILIRAIVEVTIDSEDITKWLEKDIRERSAIIAENQELKAVIAQQEKQIDNLKLQLGNVKTAENRERVAEEFAAEDKIFLSNQKLEEGNNFHKEVSYTIWRQKKNTTLQ